nr:MULTISPECIES: hypothetical protein [unclassified Cryobacterium]
MGEPHVAVDAHHGLVRRAQMAWRELGQADVHRLGDGQHPFLQFELVGRFVLFEPFAVVAVLQLLEKIEGLFTEMGTHCTLLDVAGGA